MPRLTPDGQRIVNDLAQRHGFSPAAVTEMLVAVVNGNGGMAQFSHPEFGGSGQWMRGGMTMIGDMFNNYLKGRVDSLCSEIANILANQPGLLQTTGSFQSQNQSSGSNGGGFNIPVGNSSLFVPDPRSQWYPQDLGMPNAVGSQNNVRYAYFGNACRLAVDTGGSVWVYDTLNHQIGGFSQQQGSGGSITFTSQFGTVPLSSLPVVMRNGQAVAPQAAPSSLAPQPSYSYGNSAAPAMSNLPNTNSGASSGNGNGNGNGANSSSDIFAAIERLADLKAKGFLSDDEYSSKKAELLGRL